MTPRVRIQSRLQILVQRPKLRVIFKPHASLVLQPGQCRGFAEQNDSSTKEDDAKGMQADQLPHVSEEAAQLSKVKGEKGPDIEQGTPVEEVVKGDKKAQESLPKVMKEGLKQQDTPKGSRPFSTSVRRQAEATEMLAASENSLELPIDPGHKFGLPTLPLPPQSHFRYRYDPVVNQVTKLLMRDGKLSVAQRNMSTILSHLRTSPPPIVSRNHPLLPNAPPPSHLPLHPTLYLTLALDSVAPLMRIRSLKGAAGGGMALQVPAPLNLRQRRRQAMMWILDAADRKKGGASPFAKRVAEEIVAVVEGRSGVWDKRTGVHRLGITARANLGFMRRKRR